MNEFGSTDPHEVSIPSADITSMEVDKRCHIYINGRELPECETYGWFEAAIHEKAARERLDENGLARCGCGGKAKIWLSDFARFTYLITDYEVGCTECAMTTDWVRGKQENAVKFWNTAMGWKGGSK